MRSISNLENLLERGEFVITSECGPPKGGDRSVIEHKANLLKGNVDAVNVTDNQTSIVRMSSLASCLILKEMGIEPILQMTTRDRNRIAIQSDLLGAYALGIRNVLCLTGDHQRCGDHPQSKNVFDLDSIQLIQAIRRMRDEGCLLNGERIKEPPRFFIGGVINPFADPFEFQVVRLAKKIKAGVDFIQTQCIFNIERFKRFMEMVREKGLHEKVYILGGVTPIKSVGMARYMKESVAGIDIPDELIDRLKGVPKERCKEEGIRICIEAIHTIKEIEGIRGIHIMAIEWEEVVSEIVKESGLLPRRGFDRNE